MRRNEKAEMNRSRIEEEMCQHKKALASTRKHTDLMRNVILDDNSPRVYDGTRFAESSWSRVRAAAAQKRDCKTQGWSTFDNPDRIRLEVMDGSNLASTEWRWRRRRFAGMQFHSRPHMPSSQTLMTMQALNRPAVTSWSESIELGSSEYAASQGKAHMLSKLRSTQ